MNKTFILLIKNLIATTKSSSQLVKNNTVLLLNCEVENEGEMLKLTLKDKDDQSRRFCVGKVEVTKLSDNSKAFFNTFQVGILSTTKGQVPVIKQNMSQVVQNFENLKNDFNCEKVDFGKILSNKDYESFGIPKKDITVLKNGNWNKISKAIRANEKLKSLFDLLPNDSFNSVMNNDNMLLFKRQVVSYIYFQHSFVEINVKSLLEKINNRFILKTDDKISIKFKFKYYDKVKVGESKYFNQGLHYFNSKPMEFKINEDGGLIKIENVSAATNQLTNNFSESTDNADSSDEEPDKTKPSGKKPDKTKPDVKQPKVNKSDEGLVLVVYLTLGALSFLVIIGGIVYLVIIRGKQETRIRTPIGHVSSSNVLIPIKH